MMGVAMADEKGLVAEYRFETVVDDQTDDTSGKGHSARVHRARPIPFEIGQALVFGGDGLVDCGSGPGLDLRDAISVECWVRPDVLPESEVIIAGKGSHSYGLTYYRDGQCWWYCRGGDKAINTALAPGAWQHVVGTYDGKSSRLYVDGKVYAERVLSGPILPGESFLIGRGFQGAVAAVRVHNRALSPQEIAERRAAAGIETSAPAEPINDGERLVGTGYEVRVGVHGGIQVQVGQERYLIETMLSLPGDAIGWNRLRGQESEGEPGWKPATGKAGDGRIEVSALGAHYTLARKVELAGHRVIVTDELTCTSAEDAGILYRHQLTTPGPFAQRLLGGASQRAIRMTAENPTVFVAQSASRLGWLAEDDVLRLQMAAGSMPNQVTISADHFALQPGRSHTFRWVLYPLASEADYWAFINQARRDWDVNFTLYGPWTFFDLSRHMGLIRDPEKLKQYLTRMRLQVIALNPWVDYDNYDFETGRPMDRAKLKRLCREAVATLKRVDPNILCIGAIEGNLVSLPEDAQQAIWDSHPNRPQNQYQLTPEQMEILKKFDLRWQDCLLQNKQGQYRYELYFRGEGERKIPMIAIAVYAAPRNGQHQYWLDQARYLLEDVGLDGLYIDQFNMAFGDDQRYSYDKWDGTTVDIDAATGRITRRYLDAALVGIDARRDLADYVLTKGRYMVANTFAATRTMQSVRMHRFNESEWYIDVFSWRDGQEPPLLAGPCKGHLSTPIALGTRPSRYGDKAEANYAKIIHKAAIAYLRHGLLYYHFGTHIPESGPGAGEYGAINHMFPITPVELGPGFVIGEERVVACVSGTYRWRQERRPKIMVFDLEGRSVAVNAEVTKATGGWDVKLTVKDWAEIGVIE